MEKDKDKQQILMSVKVGATILYCPARSDRTNNSHMFSGKQLSVQTWTIYMNQRIKRA